MMGTRNHGRRHRSAHHFLDASRLQRGVRLGLSPTMKAGHDETATYGDFTFSLWQAQLVYEVVKRREVFRRNEPLA